MERVDVAAGIIRRNGRILIAQRHKDAHMGLKWEFPGGKIEPGEDARSCLKREIKEELDLEIEVEDNFMAVEHPYAEKIVNLQVYWCQCRGGEPKARDCQDFAWVKVSDLGQYPFADADKPVVKVLLEGYL